MAVSPPSFELAAFKQLIATPTLPDLGPGPRANVEQLEELNRRLDSFLATTHCSLATRELLRCAAFLWHDHHETAHEIAQNNSTAEGSFLHGILHRREPDYGNAKYWFHRVGKHACFEKIAEEVAELITSQPDCEPELDLLPRGTWDPFAFIDACEAAALLHFSNPRRKLLQEIQAVEFDSLLEHLSLAPRYAD